MPAPGPIQRVLSLFTSFHPGPRLVDGTDLRNLTNYLFTCAKVGLTALAGGGQLNATPLSSAFNQFDVVATGGDSCALPAAIAGQTISVFNNGASSLQVFGITSDLIVPQGARTGAGVAGNVGVSLTSGNACQFVCYQTSIWKQQQF